MGCAAMDEKKEQKASNDNELLEKEQSGWLGSLKVRQEKMVARGKGRQHDTSHPKIETASAASAPSVMQELAVAAAFLGRSIASSGFDSNITSRRSSWCHTCQGPSPCSLERPIVACVWSHLGRC